MRFLKFSPAFILVAVLAQPSDAPGRPENIPGPIPALVVRVVDGDTIIVRARIWLGQVIETQVRLNGADAPEIKGKCSSERHLAQKARDLIITVTGNGQVILRDIQYGKYAGRVVARVLTPAGRDFSQVLIKAGLGRPYNGRRREPWCSIEEKAQEKAQGKT